MPTKHNIKMVRGDTYKFKFQRVDENGIVITTTPTEIYFTVKEDADTTVKEIQYSFSDEEITVDDNYWWHVHIKHGDTANLEYGVHYYDIQIIEEDEVHTRLQGKLTLTDEITYEPDSRG